jgi:polar amino acid transport system substrate-binding protein
MSTRLLAAILSACVPAAFAAPVQLLTENNPPFNYADGKEVKGIGAKKVQELFAKAGVESTTTVGAWNDSYQKAQATANACIFSTARVESRERLFRWIGPIATNTWALYGLPTFDKPIATARDARFFKVGAVKNDAKVDFLREEGVSSIREADKDSANPARLARPKTDPDYIELWITTSATAREVAAAAGVKDLKEVAVVRKQDLYLACNPRIDKETFGKLEAAWKAMPK